VLRTIVRDRARVDGTEILDPAKRAQRGILHNVLGVVGIAGEPLRETIGFGHVWQKDFIEHHAIIFVRHNWVLLQVRHESRANIVTCADPIHSGVCGQTGSTPQLRRTAKHDIGSLQATDHCKRVPIV
jgi:hypothetical protein